MQLDFPFYLRRGITTAEPTNPIGSPKFPNSLLYMIIWAHQRQFHGNAPDKYKNV
jgi:hypothetical protein